MGPTLLGPFMQYLQIGLKLKGQIGVLIFNLSFKPLLLVSYTTYSIQVSKSMGLYKVQCSILRGRYCPFNVYMFLMFGLKSHLSFDLAIVVKVTVQGQTQEMLSFKYYDMTMYV